MFEDLGVLRASEVAVLAAAAVRADDAVDELLRLDSRCGVPTAPRKYFVVTMLAALTDQKSGNSTPCCSKLTEPSRQFVMMTLRRSQVTSS